MKIGFSMSDGSPVDLTVAQDGRSASGRVDRWGQAHVARSARAGRVNALPLTIAHSPEGRVHPRQLSLIHI